ncbi:MAG: cytochrome b [Paracoccaceae bacterium]
MSQPLPLRDTPRVYGRITRLLHWSIAALILWQLVGMALKIWLGRESSLAATFVGSHQMVGTAVFLLIVLRMLWALANAGNRPAHGHGLIGLAARLGHLALYAVMLIVPLVAMLRAYGGTRPFAPFGFTVFPGQAEPIQWMVDLGGALHGELGWVMAAMIAGHVVMVGIHEGMWRDGTLARMAGRRAA